MDRSLANHFCGDFGLRCYLFFVHLNEIFWNMPRGGTKELFWLSSLLIPVCCIPFTIKSWQRPTLPHAFILTEKLPDGFARHLFSPVNTDCSIWSWILFSLIWLGQSDPFTRIPRRGMVLGWACSIMRFHRLLGYSGPKALMWCKPVRARFEGTARGFWRITDVSQ